MKNIKYIVIALVLLATGTAFGATAKKVIEILQKDNIANIYVAGGDIQIYKVVDGLNTCYLSYQGAKGYYHSLSCVKN